MTEPFIKDHEDEITKLRLRLVSVEQMDGRIPGRDVVKIETFNKIMRRIAKLESRITAARHYQAWKDGQAADVVFGGLAP